jgi:hypothetical protein
MAIDQEFIDEYSKLLILQYYNKPKARAEVEAMSSHFSRIFTLYDSFFDAFDVDIAVGDQLDIIGKIVGISRIVDNVYPKILFGFDGDSTARGFSDLFNDAVVSAPFKDLFESDYTPQQLDDATYRFLIKAKIAKNVASAYLVSDERITIQDVVRSVFGDGAYVIDNQDMSLTLYIGLGVDIELLAIVRELDLLPRPQGVYYKFVISADYDSFGFSDDPNALGFGDVFDSTVGGAFAELII